MNDDEIADEIAMKLAEAMGWKKWDAFSEDKGWIEGDSVFVYHPSGIADSPRFHPDTRGDHIWICLEWAQKEFGPFHTTLAILEGEEPGTFHSVRKSWFQALSEQSISYRNEEDLTPMHICKAILKAVEE